MGRNPGFLPCAGPTPSYRQTKYYERAGNDDSTRSSRTEPGKQVSCQGRGGVEEYGWEAGDGLLAWGICGGGSHGGCAGTGDVGVVFGGQVYLFGACLRGGEGVLSERPLIQCARCGRYFPDDDCTSGFCIDCDIRLKALEAPAHLADLRAVYAGRVSTHIQMKLQQLWDRDPANYLRLLNQAEKDYRLSLAKGEGAAKPAVGPVVE